MNKAKKNMTLIILCMGTFFCMLDTTIMTIVLPEIESGLNASLDQLSWAVNLYTIVFASLTLILGRMAEIRGQNKYMLYGLILFAVGSIFSGISHSLSFLYFGRIVQSIDAAIILPLATTIGLASVDVEKRNKIVAVLGGIQGLAAAIGPTIGGWISQYYGWRWVFFINVPFLGITILILPFVMSLKKNNKTGEKEHLDFLGAFLSMIMMFTLTLALIKGEDWHWDSVAIISLFVTSDEFFDLVKDPYLKVNKGKNHKRPHYFAFKMREGKDMYWVAPLSSKVEKFKIVAKKQAQGKPTDILFRTKVWDKASYLFLNDLNK